MAFLFKNKQTIDDESIKWSEQIRTLIMKLEAFTLTLENNLPKVKDLQDESNILYYLYLMMLITMTNSMIEQLNQAIWNRMWDYTDDRLLTLLEKVKAFLAIECSNTNNIKKLINDLDEKARDFDGYVFGYWTVRDIIGSIRGKEVKDFDADILEYIQGSSL